MMEGRLTVHFERAAGGDAGSGPASEASLTGLFVETSAPLPQGTLLALDVVSPDGTTRITLDARVTSARSPASSARGLGPVGMMVRFLELPDDVAEELQRLLDATSGSAGGPEESVHDLTVRAAEQMRRDVEAELERLPRPAGNDEAPAGTAEPAAVEESEPTPYVPLPDGAQTFTDAPVAPVSASAVDAPVGAILHAAERRATELSPASTLDDDDDLTARAGLPRRRGGLRFFLYLALLAWIGTGIYMYRTRIYAYVAPLLAERGLIPAPPPSAPATAAPTPTPSALSSVAPPTEASGSAPTVTLSSADASTPGAGDAGGGDAGADASRGDGGPRDAGRPTRHPKRKPKPPPASASAPAEPALPDPEPPTESF